MSAIVSDVACVDEEINWRSHRSTIISPIIFVVIIVIWVEQKGP